MMVMWGEDDARKFMCNYVDGVVRMTIVVSDVSPNVW